MLGCQTAQRVTAAISAEEQQARWQKVPPTLPWRPQMSWQVGRLLVSLGVDSSTAEAARGGLSVSFFCCWWVFCLLSVFIYRDSVSVLLSSPSSIYSSGTALAHCPGRNVRQDIRALTAFMFKCEGQETASVMFIKQTCWPLTLPEAKIWWPRENKTLQVENIDKTLRLRNPQDPFVLDKNF